MKRLFLLAITIALLAGMTAVTVSAEDSFVPQEWTGGNGWCDQEAGICFRAWSTSQGVSVTWKVTANPAPELRIVRYSLTKGEGEVVLDSSNLSGDFTVLDSNITPGNIYLYQLERVNGQNATAVGDFLEAGIAATGGGSENNKVFLPMLSMN